MLHNSKSKKISFIKCSLVIPLLVLFVFNFNTEIMAQTKEPQTQKTTTAQNVLKYVITKDTKDPQLESIKENLAKNKATITFENVERNDRHELTGIKIGYEHNGALGNFFMNSENPIGDIAISLNATQNKLTVGPATKNLSQSFEIVKSDGDTTLKKEDTNSNVVVYSTDADGAKDGDVMVIGKDGDAYAVKKAKTAYVIKSGTTKDNTTDDESMLLKKSKNDTVWITKDVKNIVWTDDDGNVTQINASEKGNTISALATDGNQKPLFFIDDKKASYDELATLKPETIANLVVLKNEDAIKAYGQEGKDGVILVTTKTAESNLPNASSKTTTDIDANTINLLSTGDVQPLLILDGKEISKQELDLLPTEKIQAINVLKGEKALEKYGAKGQQGVIEITSKNKD